MTKHVFWQAFFVTVLFLLIGIVMGVYLEQLRSDNINLVLYESETSLYDSFALGKLLDNNVASCEELKKTHINFADKIFNEAKELEEYDDSNKLTDSLKQVHRKYDLLRTLLWIDLVRFKEICGEVNTAVYLYEYDSEEVQVTSKQIAWSRVLEDFKEVKGEDLILIPIAVDQDISSLDYLITTYGIRNFPAVVINEKNILYEPATVEELEKFLD